MQREAAATPPWRTRVHCGKPAFALRLDEKIRGERGGSAPPLLVLAPVPRGTMARRAVALMSTAAVW